MLECKKIHTDQLTSKDVDQLVFYPVPQSEEWRIGFVEELLEIRDNNAYSIDWTKNDVKSTIDFIMHIITSIFFL